MPAERTPWGALLMLAAQLGLQPAAFWRLSLREWRAITSAPRTETLSRGAFDKLSAQFPDRGR